MNLLPFEHQRAGSGIAMFTAEGPVAELAAAPHGPTAAQPPVLAAIQ